VVSLTHWFSYFRGKIRLTYRILSPEAGLDEAIKIRIPYPGRNQTAAIHIVSVLTELSGLDISGLDIGYHR
jgi:hypothetical protein